MAAKTTASGDSSRSFEMVPDTSHREVSGNPGEILPSLPPQGGEGGWEVSLQAPGFPGQNGCKNTSRPHREGSEGQISPGDTSLPPRPWSCMGNTSAAPAAPDLDGYQRALAAAKAIGPVPPSVTFHEAGGGIAVMLGDEPAGWITKGQVEELKRRLKDGDGR